MKKSVILSAALVSLISAQSFAAPFHALNKEQVNKAFQNKTITTISAITMDGKLVNNTFTGYFNKDQVNGQLANQPENSAPQNDQGTWLVKNNGALCVTWQHWNQQKPICINIYELKNAYVFINADTGNFESMVPKNNIQDGNQLSSSGNSSSGSAVQGQ